MIRQDWDGDVNEGCDTLAIFPKDFNIQLTPNFRLSEFHCTCNYPECHYTLLHMGLVGEIQYLRLHFQRPIFITSGFRCQQHNKDVGGTLESYHTIGFALDFAVDGMSAEEVCKEMRALIKNSELFIGGLGYYPVRNFNHIDARSRHHGLVYWQG